jgi:excisionase family DNA binding protein
MTGLRYETTYVILRSFWSADEKGRTNVNRNISPTATIDLLAEELLELYLSLPEKQREERFTDTARAAEISGLSVRTIQFWIESGAVQAVSVGRKYRVDLNSLREYLKCQIHKRAS